MDEAGEDYIHTCMHASLGVSERDLNVDHECDDGFGFGVCFRKDVAVFWRKATGLRLFPQ